MTAFTVLILFIVISFGLWLSFKYDICSVNLFNRILSKGFGSLGKEETSLICCNKCKTVTRREETTPYCPN
ncbi:hypothetical protein CR205_04010 [Alteribacter lacisalsi]|uniref:Uncharacterized protein n=1 Tax=Alteribacter lacisalsi TaxID=2045244 RepID=A0A2W0H9G3_9BACI|nr:hypothetical protein [Alteribacter lacisalsi]PYZ97767.1 hypothetical protein CR205_04010 [Alteribacter lacisalsi]